MAIAALLLRVSGPEHLTKVTALVTVMNKVLSEEADKVRVRLAIQMIEVRVTNLFDTITPEEIAVAAAAKCAQ